VKVSLVNGTIAAKLQGHEETITSVHVGADGLRAVSTSRDHTVRAWDLERDALLATFYGESEVMASALHGRTVVAGEMSGRMHFLQLLPSA
jgi:WD40 repeat protein